VVVTPGVDDGDVLAEIAATTVATGGRAPSAERLEATCCGSLKFPTLDHRNSPVCPWGAVGLG
jgi:hypothetical protein